MGRKYRYEFTKKVYPEYIVFLVVKNKYVTYGLDLDLVNYIINENKIRNTYGKKRKSTEINIFNLLDRYKINYLILDNLDIITKKDYLDNNYNKYIYLFILNKVINNIGNNLVKTSLL